MISIVMIILVVVIFGAAAVYARIHNKRYRRTQSEIINSPMAEAIGQLIGIAGGIYISLLMVVNFLGMDWPKSLLLFGVGVDPLALFAVFLAGIQPIVLHLVYRFYH